MGKGGRGGPSVLCGGVAVVMEGLVYHGIPHYQLYVLPVESKPLTALPPMLTPHLRGLHFVSPPMRVPLPLQHPKHLTVQ